MPLDPRSRLMFDYEVEDTRNELELMETAENFHDPAELIEEFMQTLVLLVERQPAASAKVLRLMVLSLSLENESLAARALEQLLDFLELPGDLLRYLIIHIQISPTDFAPSGSGARILHWSGAQQREKDMQMMGVAEQ